MMPKSQKKQLSFMKKIVLMMEREEDVSCHLVALPLDVEWRVRRHATT
jgi:hypothetical protein